MADEKTVEAQNNTQVRATVENKAPKPAGLLPKNTQQLVILGVAVVMVLIMWMTSGNKRVATSRNRLPARRASSHPIPQRLKTSSKPFSKSRPLRGSRSLRQISLASKPWVSLAMSLPVAPFRHPMEPCPNLAASLAVRPEAHPLRRLIPSRKTRKSGSTSRSLRRTSPSRLERARRQSNSSARARRAALSTQTTPQVPPNTGELDAQVRQAEAQLLAAGQAAEREARGIATPQAEANKTQPAQEQRLGPDQSRPGELNSAIGKRYVVFEGTVLETILINRLNGTFAGPVSCLVTTDIYSHDRQHVLIPAGTKVLGEAKKVEATGQQRLAVFFHRMIMPDGYSVSLDQFKGLNQIGETALRDKVNNHYLQIFGASLAVGILGGVAEAGTGNTFTSSPMDRAREGFGASLATSSAQILDRFLNILPTVTIREGNRVKVYLSGDLLLPDYAQHTMQSDL